MFLMNNSHSWLAIYPNHLPQPNIHLNLLVVSLAKKNRAAKGLPPPINPVTPSSKGTVKFHLQKAATLDGVALVDGKSVKYTSLSGFAQLQQHTNTLAKMLKHRLIHSRSSLGMELIHFSSSQNCLSDASIQISCYKI
jgi:hypothetical protein